jgi:hypothetical protein
MGDLFARTRGAVEADRRFQAKRTQKAEEAFDNPLALRIVEREDRRRKAEREKALVEGKNIEEDFVDDKNFAGVIGEGNLTEPVFRNDVCEEDVVRVEVGAIQFAAEIMEILGSRAKDTNALERREGFVDRFRDARLKGLDENDIMLEKLGLGKDQ